MSRNTHQSPFHGIGTKVVFAAFDIQWDLVVTLDFLDGLVKVFILGSSIEPETVKEQVEDIMASTEMIMLE